MSTKPLRQAGVKTSEKVKVDASLPWWATAKVGEMTEAAKREQARMSASREAKQVSSSYILGMSLL